MFTESKREDKYHDFTTKYMYYFLTDTIADSVVCVSTTYLLNLRHGTSFRAIRSVLETLFSTKSPLFSWDALNICIRFGDISESRVTQPDMAFTTYWPTNIQIYAYTRIRQHGIIIHIYL